MTLQFPLTLPEGLGFSVQCLELRVKGFGFGVSVKGLGFRVRGFGFRASQFKPWELGFMV